jgi:hypothetical protein
MRCVREGHSFVLSEPVKLVVPHKELHVAWVFSSQENPSLLVGIK